VPTPLGAVGPSPPWLGRLASVAGPIGPVRPLSGNAWMVEAGGQRVVAKLGPGTLDEADGLRRLSEVPGGPPVPKVVLADSDLLVTVMVDQSGRSAAHEESLGRSLGVLHEASVPHWGGGSSWVGACPVDPAPWSDGAGFYGARLRALATRCGLDEVVSGVAARLGELLPPAGPSLLHGDLWWGNVLFGADGRSWLIDPSVHGGHPEEDLAMLALFGAVPDRVLRAYWEVRPAAPGWEERIALFQLYPLLVHAVLFGGGYRTQADAVARRFA
jgi:fructosamine-3-kinase